MKAFIDSDILIRHLRGYEDATRFLVDMQKSREYELWIGAIQRAEIVFFMRPEEEKGTMRFLSEFSTAAVDAAIVDNASMLYRRWNPSHGSDINDMLLAATVQLVGGHLFTLNKKHYPMTDIIIKSPW